MQWHLKLQNLDRLLNHLFRPRSTKYQSSASLAFVRGIHQWPVNSLHKGPVARKMVPFDDVTITMPIRHIHMILQYWIRTAHPKVAKSALPYLTMNNNCLVTCEAFASYFYSQLLPHPRPKFIIHGKIYIIQYVYCQISNMNHTKSQNLIVSHHALPSSLPNPLKPGVKLRMKM